MAAKGSKARRGRGKGTEAATEPTTSPEATVPDEDEGLAESQPHAGTEDSQPSQEREEAETVFEPTEPMEPSEPIEPGPEPEEPVTWRVSHLIVGGLGALLVVAVLAGALLYGLAGDPGRLDEQAQRLDVIAAQAESQLSRLDAAEDAIAGLRSELDQVTTAVGQLQSSLSDLQSVAEANQQNLDRMTQGIEELRSAADVPADGTAAGEAVGQLQGTIETLDERVASLEQGGSLDDLTGRIARLEEQISGLRDQAGERIDQAESASALGRTYAALTERVAAGAPFADELEAMTAELPSAPGLEKLRPLAEAGVPTVSDLQTRLDGIAAELPRQVSADTAAADGLWETMRQRLEGMVTVRRADEADWPAVFDRAGEALQRGDVEAAIAEVEQVRDAAPGEIEDWLADARARRDAEAGLDELSDAVLRQFAGQQ